MSNNSIQYKTMQTNKNSFLAKAPVAGTMYKLWSLPTGSTVERPNVLVRNQEVKSFRIVEHAGSISYCETNWGEMFHLDASLEASFIKFN
jgi:hypothetical protein